MNILHQIIERKKQEVSAAKSKITVEQLQDSEFFHRQKLSLKDSLKSKSGIIAEFKRKSPSKGLINGEADVLEVAKSYENCGASGISVLTDTHFFGGSIQDILNIRNEINVPLLRKDFMIDEYQFYEAKSIGADVVLLIAACLSPSQVKDFTSLSHELGMEVLQIGRAHV